MDREGNCSMQIVNKEIFLNALTHALCLLKGGLVQEKRTSENAEPCME